MRITEILVESQVNEGPGWDQTKQGLKQVGSGIGNVAKGAATGVGNVLGSVGKGVGNAIRGFKQGMKGDLSGFASDVARSAGKGRKEPTVGDTSKLNAAPTAAKTTPAQQNTPTAADPAATTPTAAKTTPAQQNTPAAAKEPTLYKQVQDLINKLDKKGKQRTLQYIEKSLGKAPAKAQPAETPNLQVQQGGKQTNAKATPKTAASQAELDADQAAMATGTGESVESKKKVVVEFYSNFLGRMI